MWAKRERLVIPAVALGLGAVATMGIWARWIEPAWIETTFTKLEWRGPALRIALITDLHARPDGEGRTRRVVRRTNILAPDLVLIGGDFVDGLDADPRKLRALRPLSGLRARLGIYAVLGNHDSVHDGEDTIRRCVEHAGIRVLMNEHVSLPGGAVLVGLGDLRAHETEPRPAFADVPEDAPTIVLAHGPKALELPAVGRFDLALAGHTHGGQGCIPFTHVCPYLEDDMKPWVKGLYDWPKGGRLYVSRGLGTSGYPARIGARPEIACLDLVRASLGSRSNRST
jgi:uncharacterized protein